MNGGGPQSSLLSPLLFNVYVQSLVASLAQMDCQVFNYADDTHLLLLLDSSPDAQVNAKAILCFITNGMSHNSIKLNPDKTELVVINAHINPWSDLYWPAELGTSPVLALAAKSLGITLDVHLSMTQQVSLVCRTCVGLFRRPRKLVPLFSFDTLQTAISATIMSRLDYGNTLNFGSGSWISCR